MSSAPDAPPTFPRHSTALMRGHGFTCVGTTIEEAVYRSIFLCSNARIQTASLLLQNTFNTRKLTAKGVEDVFPIVMEDIKSLSERECKDAWETLQGNAKRSWKLWCAEVENSGLYKNTLGQPAGS